MQYVEKKIGVLNIINIPTVLFKRGSHTSCSTGSPLITWAMTATSNFSFLTVETKLRILT